MRALPFILSLAVSVANGIATYYGWRYIGFKMEDSGGVLEALSPGAVILGFLGGMLSGTAMMVFLTEHAGRIVPSLAESGEAPSRE